MRTFRAVSNPPTQFEIALQRAIQEAAEGSDPYDLQDWLHVEPARVRPGMIVLADGTDWDPGDGLGCYVRDEDNAAWIFLGPFTVPAPTTDSFTATGTGFSGTVTATWNYTISDGVVTLTINELSGTSNANTFTVTGIPAAIQPATQRDFIVRVSDSGGAGNTSGLAELSGGTITLSITVAGTTNLWNVGSTKTIRRNSLTYRLAD